MDSVKNKGRELIPPLVYKKFINLIATESNNNDIMNDLRLQEFINIYDFFEFNIKDNDSSINNIFVKYYLGMLLEKCPFTFEKAYPHFSKNQRLKTIMSLYLDVDNFFMNNKEYIPPQLIQSIYMTIPIRLRKLIAQWDLAEPYFVIYPATENEFERALFQKNQVAAIFKREEPTQDTKKTRSCCVRLTNYISSFFYHQPSPAQSITVKPTVLQSKY